MALFANQFYVRQKLHFHRHRAVTLTSLAASALHIETEAARPIAARAGLGHGGKDFANRREQAGVRRGVGARRASDRALVDFDHPINVIQTLDPIEVRATGRRVIERSRDGAKQGVIDEG